MLSPHAHARGLREQPLRRVRSVESCPQAPGCIWARGDRQNTECSSSRQAPAQPPMYGTGPRKGPHMVRRVARRVVR